MTCPRGIPRDGCGHGITTERSLAALGTVPVVLAWLAQAHPDRLGVLLTVVDDGLGCLL